VEKLVFKKNSIQTPEKSCSFAQTKPVILCSPKAGSKKAEFEDCHLSDKHE